MEILSDATFKGDVTFNKSVSFDGCIMAFNSAAFNQHVTFKETATVDKFFQVGHNGSCTGTELAVGGNTFITGNTAINGHTNVGGDIMLHKDILLYNDKFDPTRVLSKISISEFNLGTGAITYNVNGTDSTSIEISKNLEIGSSDQKRSFSLNGNPISNWSDIKNYISLPQKRIFTSPTIPANCTAFEFTGSNCISYDSIIQVKKASDGKSVIAETWITSNLRPAMSFAGCTSEIPAGTYKIVAIEIP